MPDEADCLISNTNNPNVEGFNNMQIGYEPSFNETGDTVTTVRIVNPHDSILPVIVVKDFEEYLKTYIVKDFWGWTSNSYIGDFDE